MTPRDSVLRYPDLAAQLCAPPLNYARPEQWTGYIPPPFYGGAINVCARREALVRLVDEAERRDHEGWTPPDQNTEPTKENP